MGEVTRWYNPFAYKFTIQWGWQYRPRGVYSSCHRWVLHASFFRSSKQPRPLESWEGSPSGHDNIFFLYGFREIVKKCRYLKQLVFVISFPWICSLQDGSQLNSSVVTASPICFPPVACMTPGHGLHSRSCCQTPSWIVSLYMSHNRLARVFEGRLLSSQNFSSSFRHIAFVPAQVAQSSASPSTEALAGRQPGHMSWHRSVEGLNRCCSQFELGNIKWE